MGEEGGVMESMEGMESGDPEEDDGSRVELRRPRE